MHRPSKTLVFLLTAGCFLAFFAFGFTDNLKGPTLPAILADLKISYGTGGNIFFGEFLGFLIATLLTGILADRFGNKSAVVLAGFLTLAGVGGYMLLRSACLMAGAMFVIGLGLGALELGTNAIIVDLHPGRKGMFLNLMSVMHGLGSLIAPLVAGAALAAGTSWRWVYRWDVALVAAFFLYFMLMRFPPRGEHVPEAIRLQDIPRFAFRDGLPFYHLAIALYVATEIGIAAWLVTFLQQARGASIEASTQALSLFFGLIMVGRLVGGFLVHRVGYLRSILLASLGVAVCIGLGLFGPPSLAVLLPGSGLFCSIIFPTITAAVSDAHPAGGNTVLGMLFTFAGVGGLVGPWLVGWVSELFGLHSGFAVILALSLLMAASIAVLNGRRIHAPQTA